jgi:hypothetical protein
MAHIIRKINTELGVFKIFLFICGLFNEAGNNCLYDTK